MNRSIVVAAVITGAAVAWFLLLQGGGQPPTSERPVAPSPESRFAAEQPGTVRIVTRVTPPDVRPSAPVDVRERPVGEFNHIGPLAPAAVHAFADSFRAEQAACNRRLLARSARTSGGSDTDLLAEAETLLAMERFAASATAIESGSYITTDVGADAPSLLMDGAEVAAVPSEVGGRDVVVTILMPYDEYGNLARAREYYDALHSFSESEKARKFNELPDDVRLPLAERLRAIMNNQRATDTDRKFLYDQIGFARLTERNSLAIIR